MFGTKITKEELTTAATPKYAPRISKPYLGPAVLTKAGRVDIGRDDMEKKTTIQFEFKCLAPETKGLTHQHTEWNPNDDDPTKLESKIKNLKLRLGYMLGYFVDEDEAVDVINSAESWEQLVDGISALLERGKEGWQSKAVSIKVLGSVWNGSTKLAFPNYLGFISDENSAQVVAFSTKEIANNREYLDALESPSSSSAELDVAGTTVPSVF